MTFSLAEKTTLNLKRLSFCLPRIYKNRLFILPNFKKMRNLFF
jgi:hypothetical protein